MYQAKRLAGDFLYHGFMSVLAVFFLIPIFWVVLTSLKTDVNLFNAKQIIPDPATLSHYVNLFKSVPDLPRITANTAIIAFMSTFGQLLSCSLAGYALARMRFPGRNLIFFTLLATLMVPGQATLIPIYVLFRNLHLINTLQALFVPSFFGNAFATFFFRQFFMTIPKELEEAAYIDGARPLTTFWQIIVPISTQAYLALGLLSFVGAWNGFFLPTIYLQTRDKWVLTQGLRSLIGRDNSAWGEIIAGVVLISLPVVILYFFVQEYFTEGISFTGIKG